MSKLMPAWVKWEPATNCLVCGGDWSYQYLPSVIKQLKDLCRSVSQNVQLNGAEIVRLDTSGGMALMHFIQFAATKNIQVSLTDLNESQQHCLSLVKNSIDIIQTANSADAPSWLYQLGELAVEKWRLQQEFFAFVGELFCRLFTMICHPKYFRFVYFSNAMEHCGLYALPLIAFLSFLIGVVLAYQMGLQLRMYGANIFIVNLLSMSILREFSPLITAILVAGRSGSAFTAQIGTMVVRQEVDALRTLGLRPFDFLVIPRVIALMLVMPLLTVWSVIFALFGGMVMSKAILDIGYTEFLLRLRSEISLDTYLLGLIKTPVFGIVIAMVGCFQGFKVSGSAASVGHQTTKSVVQALFLIIILDAVFSVLFSLSGF